MLARLRQRLALRAAVALLLSGAPRLAATLAPEPAHHCECPAHGGDHRCTCPVCNAAARIARQRQLRDVPPCHREAARRVAAEQDREPPGPCLGPTCGRGDARMLVVSGEDSFTFAAAPALPAGEPAAPPRSPPSRPSERPSSPEPPPPRA
jgi:hypothetical protein